MRNLDSTIEDAAKSLGAGSFRIYSSVVIPRLKKPIIYSSLLVGLYVISDFGAVSLMKYSTITKAIYSYYTININSDPVIFYSTLLILLALIISFTQRSSELGETSKVSGTPKEFSKIDLSYRNKFFVYSFYNFDFLVYLPISVLSYWLVKGVYYGSIISASISGAIGSLTISVLTSMFAILIATPIVVMISQYKSKIGSYFEKITLLCMDCLILQLESQCYLLL